MLLLLVLFPALLITFHLIVKISIERGFFKTKNASQVLYVKDYLAATFWIFVIFTPTFIIVLIKLINLLNISYLELGLLILLYILPAMLLIENLNIIMKHSGTSEKHIKVIENKKVETKNLMEYVVIFILPFITVGDQLKDLIVILIVVLLLITSIIKMNLYYFNLPVLLFFNIYFVEIEGTKKILLTKNSQFKDGKYKVNNYIPILSVAILVEEKK